MQIALGDKFNLKIAREKGGRFYIVEQNGKALNLDFPKADKDTKNINTWQISKQDQTFWLVWSKSAIGLSANLLPKPAELKRFLNDVEKTFESRRVAYKMEIQTNRNSTIYRLSL